MVKIAGPRNPASPKGEAIAQELMGKLSGENQALVIGILGHMEALSVAGSKAAKESAERELVNSLLNVPKVRRQIVDTAIECLQAKKTEFIKIREVDKTGVTTGWRIEERETPDHRIRIEAMRVLANLVKPKPAAGQRGTPYIDDEEAATPIDFIKRRREAQGA